MLNRTLSANLNGLNFGTRTLATLAGLNIVATQGLRHAHPRKRKDSMRDMDAKSMRDPSIRGTSAISPFMCSPSGSPFWPYPANPSLSRSEVVVVRPVEVEAHGSALLAERASRAGRSQVQAQPGVQTLSWRPTTMTRTEMTPAASFAAGG